MRLGNFFGSKSRTRMPLGDARILFVDTGMAQHIGADRAVGEIWLRAVAVQAATPGLCCSKMSRTSRPTG